jgi:hypothetical protein
MFVPLEDSLRTAVAPPRAGVRFTTPGPGSRMTPFQPLDDSLRVAIPPLAPPCPGVRLIGPCTPSEPLLLRDANAPMPLHDSMLPDTSETACIDTVSLSRFAVCATRGPSNTERSAAETVALRKTLTLLLQVAMGS